ncbi:arginine deiminase [Vibrio artabrorum]|uniref:arginine deiminase n=1 Tax=Vibrio artabrorum TaxID=446374 RepID=UPI0021C3B0BD|nr:arginine deiminase [Vibrio artabrorum]
MEKYIQVHSEIGELKRVLLHRPGEELNRLHPDYLQDMLFEDTPYLPVAQKEHDFFANALRENGVEVVYMRDLFSEAMLIPQAKEEFINEFISLSHIKSEIIKLAVKKLYIEKKQEEFIDVVLQGIRKDELSFDKPTLANYLMSDYPYVVDPLSAVYYMRDNSISVGDGTIISRMSKRFREREPLLLKYIHKYVPRFVNSDIKYWYDDDAEYGIEGGDVAVLSEKVVAIGCSERTTFGAIENLSEKLLRNGFERVVVFDMVEKKRSTMHLDDIMTMVDHDKFIINAMMDDREKINVYCVELFDEQLSIELMSGELKTIFEQVLEVEHVTLISCGNGDLVDGIREMWNLGANVLTLAPGKVIAFSRNDITNKQLEDIGIEVIKVPDAELVKGRGGPRCMSMPLLRVKAL